MIEKKKEELTEEEKRDKEQFARDYSQMIEHKLRKAERRTWMIKDLDFLD